MAACLLAEDLHRTDPRTGAPQNVGLENELRRPGGIPALKSTDKTGHVDTRGTSFAARGIVTEQTAHRLQNGLVWQIGSLLILKILRLLHRWSPLIFPVSFFKMARRKISGPMGNLLTLIPVA